MKKIISLMLIAFTIIGGTIIPSYGAVIEDNTVTPMWNNIHYVSTNIGFGDGEATASGGCMRKTGVDLLEGTISVFMNYNGSWFRLGKASKSVEIGTLAVGVDFACQSGVEYRADFTVTAYRDGVGETFTDVIYKTCP